MASSGLYIARYLLPQLGPPIEDGALLVRAGRIAAVGRRQDLLRENPQVPVSDFGDGILLPPLANAHTHLELTDFPAWARSCGETGTPGSFVDWILRVIRVKAAIPGTALAASVTNGVRQSLRAGTGAVGDILSYFPARSAHAASPLRGRLFLEVLGRQAQRWETLLNGVREVLDTAPPGHLGFGLSPHSPYTLAENYLRQALALAGPELPVAIHLAESAEETTFLAAADGPLVTRLYPRVGWGQLLPPPAGFSPVAYLQACGGLRPHTLLVHGVQVGAEDVARIARSGAAVALCPRSNARLEVGRVPLADYLAAGIPLALGTDSLASNDSLSVWDELAFAGAWFAAQTSPWQLLATATLGGARALGLDGEMGALAAGWGGHFQVLQPATMPNLAELGDYLCGGCGDDLTGLFLDGIDVLPDVL